MENDSARGGCLFEPAPHGTFGDPKACVGAAGVAATEVSLGLVAGMNSFVEVCVRAGVATL